MKHANHQQNIQLQAKVTGIFPHDKGCIRPSNGTVGSEPLTWARGDPRAAFFESAALESYYKGGFRQIAWEGLITDYSA